MSRRFTGRVRLARRAPRLGPATPLGLAPALLGLLLAPPSARAAFERPPVGPAEAALGSPLAVGGDPVFGNPARAAGAGAGLAASGARPFGLPELAESQAAGWAGGQIGPEVRLSVGLGARTFGSPAWAEREARLVAAVSPAPGLAGALAVRGLEAGGPGVSPRRSIALDLAFLVRAGEAEIGGVVEAVAGDVPGDPEGRRHRTALGLARRAGPARLLVEVQRAGERPLAARVGAALALPAGLRLRAGLQQDPAEVTWGFGIRIGPLRLDVAAAEGHPLGRTVRLGVRLDRRAGPVSP